MSHPSLLRATFLRLVIVSIVASCVLGVVAVLVAGGSTSAKAFITSLCGTAASLLALLGALGLERTQPSRWGLPTILGALLGFGLIVFEVWSDSRSDDSEQLSWKLATTFIVLSATGAHSIVLGMARLGPGRQPTLTVVRGLAVLFGLALVGGMWAEVDSEGFWRAVGALGVLLAAGTLLVPILARMARVQHEQASAVLGTLIRFCPACGAGVTPVTRRATCLTCQRTFRIDFDGAAGSPFA